MAKFLKSCTVDGYPLSSSEICFLGRSNVGKSSLINALYGKKTAYVGKRPGKTRMLNFFDIDSKYTIVDVPGYGYASRSNEEIILFDKMMDSYFSSRDVLKLAVVIVDARHKPTADDIDMLEYLRHFNIPFIVLNNKIDKLSNNEFYKNYKVTKDTLGIDDNQIINISAETKKNIDTLKEYLENHLML